MTPRDTGYPEFAEAWRRGPGREDIWESGQLSPVSRFLGGDYSGDDRPVWKACETLRRFLSDLPETVGAADTVSFVVGAPHVETALLPDAAQDELRRWFAWLAEIYGMGLTFCRGIPLPDATDTRRRLTDLVYDELDPFVARRIRYWRGTSG